MKFINRPENAVEEMVQGMSRTLPSQVKGRARQCKTLHGCGTIAESMPAV
jgi:hypothetical protein